MELCLLFAFAAKISQVLVGPLAILQVDFSFGFKMLTALKTSAAAASFTFAKQRQAEYPGDNSTRAAGSPFSGLYEFAKKGGAMRRTDEATAIPSSAAPTENTPQSTSSLTMLNQSDSSFPARGQMQTAALTSLPNIQLTTLPIFQSNEAQRWRQQPTPSDSLPPLPLLQQMQDTFLTTGPNYVMAGSYLGSDPTRPLATGQLSLPSDTLLPSINYAAAKSEQTKYHKPASLITDNREQTAAQQSFSHPQQQLIVLPSANWKSVATSALPRGPLAVVILEIKPKQSAPLLSPANNSLLSNGNGIVPMKDYNGITSYWTNKHSYSQHPKQFVAAAMLMQLLQQKLVAGKMTIRSQTLSNRHGAASANKPQMVWLSANAPTVPLWQARRHKHFMLLLPKYGMAEKAVLTHK